MLLAMLSPFVRSLALAGTNRVGARDRRHDAGQGAAVSRGPTVMSVVLSGRGSDTEQG